MNEILQLSAFACVSNIKGNPLSHQQHKSLFMLSQHRKNLLIFEGCEREREREKSTESKKRKFIVRGNGSCEWKVMMYKKGKIFCWMPLE